MPEQNWIDTRHPFTSPHYQWRDAGWLRYPSNYSSNEYDDWCYRGNDDRDVLIDIQRTSSALILLGYALAVGNFNADGNQGKRRIKRLTLHRCISIAEIVVSVPKLDHYRGAVEIMNSNLDESSIRTLNGSQMGEYFGASLCVIDLNNDG